MHFLLPDCRPQVISLMLSVLDEIVEGMSMNFAGVSACSCLYMYIVCISLMGENVIGLVVVLDLHLTDE